MKKTKKQLAEAITKAFFGDKCFIMDSSDGRYFERLGYIVTDSDNITGREPIMITVDDNGMEITWMHEDALGLSDDGIVNFLKGMMHTIDSSLKPLDESGRTLPFEYTAQDSPYK